MQSVKKKPTKVYLQNPTAFKHLLLRLDIKPQPVWPPTSNILLSHALFTLILVTSPHVQLSEEINFNQRRQYVFIIQNVFRLNIDWINKRQHKKYQNCPSWIIDEMKCLGTHFSFLLFCFVFLTWITGMIIVVSIIIWTVTQSWWFCVCAHNGWSN